MVYPKSDTNVDEIVHQIIKKLLSLGCQIRSIRPLSPNLDDVYLQYVKEGGNL
jgi:hypothetical protein